MIKNLILRYLIICIAIIVAIWLVPGIRVEGDYALAAALATTLILGLVNVFFKSIMNLFSCGCIILSLGLFLLITNALCLLLTSWLAQLFGIGFIVEGLLPAFWGSLLISLVSFVMTIVLPDN